MLISRSGHKIEFAIDEDKLKKIQDLKRTQGSQFPKFGVLVLSYNAENHIESTLSRIDVRLSEIIEEIFIFDDNSPDNTYEVAKRIKETSPWGNKLSVYKNPKNLRYGGNQKLGYQYAIDKGLDYVIMLHGDGQYAPEYLVDLMLPAVEEGHDVVFASRMMRKKDALKGGMPLYKFFGNQVLTTFENIILGTSLHEFHSGYRMYSTKILKRMPIKMNTDDFHFDTEIIIQCRHLGAPIKEVPIQTFYGDEECNVDGFRYAWDVVKAVLLYRLHQLHFIRKGSYIVNREFIHQRKLSPYGSHEQMLSCVPKAKEGKILCVGDSDGLLYQSLTKKGYEVFVVDIKDQHTTFIPDTHYQKVDLGNMKSLGFGRTFDFVLLCDVLPRVVDPESLLVQIKRYIKEEGLLLMSVPNIALWIYRLSLAIGRFNYANRGPLDRTNVRFFTKFTSEQSLINGGYSVEKMLPAGLPFEIVFSSSGKSRLLKFLDRIYYSLSRLWSEFFAYQFVWAAKITAYESAEGEGKVL